ncbi:MAG: hypothetical protein ACJAUP_001686 [Cellvibrionaceae bacterium]|jgi:hypothetical protein
MAVFPSSATIVAMLTADLKIYAYKRMSMACEGSKGHFKNRSYRFILSAGKRLMGS